MKTSTYAWIGVALVVVIAFVWLASPTKADPILQGKPATVYKSMSCGCCGVYANYAEGKGMAVTVINTQDNTKIKDEYGIPEALRSCHTTFVDGYFVEGHIPTEVIAKLLNERPDIKGIAMEGMPSGSPGMPGPKSGPFIIYAVNKDGTYKEYARI